MGVFNKVSSIVQNNMGNLTGGGIAGIAGGLAASVFNSAKNSIQTNAAAAKILNKSPLEIPDESPVAHMKQNPYEYGSVWYPSEIQNLGAGHYMIVDILETSTIGTDIGQALTKAASGSLKALGADTAAQNVAKGIKQNKSATFKNGESRITNQSSGINAGMVGSRHSRIADTIILYTPPGIKTNYAVEHAGTETGMLGKALGLKNFTDDLAMRVAGGVKDIMLEAGQFITSAIPGVGDLKGAIQKVTGRAVNNNLEMVFKGVPMREFTYSFEFAPKNRVELDSARKIISLLKFHMHPELGRYADFIVPSQFQLSFMYMDKQNLYIPKISKCVLTKMDLQHGDESVFTTFSADELGAAPVYTKMTLTFAETEIMTKQTIAKGM